MKYPLLATLILTAAVDAAPRALRDHVDIHWTYDEVDGWTCLAKTEPGGEDLFEELEEVYFPIDDIPVESSGQRYVQPEGGAYSFTGVAPDGPIWIASQIQEPGKVWPGINNYQAAGVFGSYQETDMRLSAADRSLSLPWIKLSLTGVFYQGSGSGAFSVWQEGSSGTPTVWFSNTDTTQPDTYLFEAGSHKHLNWGFGSPGIYRIRLRASAFLGPGQTSPTGLSDEFVLTYAVGDFAQWQADHFTASELDNLLISGPDADPDQDGMKNLVEFGFGSNPRSGAPAPQWSGLGLPKWSVVEENGTFYQVLDFPARRAGEQFSPMQYLPQFSSDMNWQSGGVAITTADFPVEMDHLNTVWEKVTARRPVGTVLPGRGFGRVGVAMGE